jgi:putative chitinase
MSTMNFNFTAEQLQHLIPGNREYADWHSALCEILPKYNINTVERVAGFVAQCAHESNNFRTLEENLNYSADALSSTFSRYFGPGKQNAAEYARNPQKIANYVYMDVNRTPQGALGNTQPGDGWRFRGRGIKQLTGRTNYTAFGKTVGMTAEQAADYVATKKGALESACWFWDTKKLNNFADRRDIVGMSRAINGGDIGLADRKNRWETALRVLKGSNSGTAVHNPTNILRLGSTGPQVVRLQQALGIKADGQFGPGTDRALRQWQAGVGMHVTGIADVETMKRLIG